MKTKRTQRRIKAQKRSSCGLCKPWKKGLADKKTPREIKKSLDFEQQMRDLF